MCTETTELIQAASQGHLPLVETLLANHADVNIIAREGLTALLSAALEEHWPVVETLLAAGADPTARLSPLWDPVSALDMASQKGQVRIMEAILHLGVDVNEEDEYGAPALFKAAYHDQAGAIDVLIGAGATQRDGAFSIACEWSKSKAMLALLQHGAETKTALHTVCRRSCVNADVAVSLLLRWGADETVLESGRTPADLLKFRPNSDVVERVRLLLARAPADRAWRRRGWLVMLLLRRTKATVDGVDFASSRKRQLRVEGGDDDLVAVVKTLGGIDDGLFRTVVSFL